MLKEKIKADIISAMKERNSTKKLVLSTLIGELDRVDKSPTDEKIIKIIQKMVENNKLTNTTEENIYLNVYLPKMLDTNVLDEKIKTYIVDNGLSTMRDMGKIMKYLNTDYTGMFNGKEASEISKKYL